MDLTQYVLLLAIIAGATELITRIRAKDYWTVVTILTAAVIGGLFGLSNYYPDLNAIEGVAAGFGASGALTAVGMIGKKSTPKASSPLEKEK